MKRYDSYKDSGVEWIGEIPGHWEVVPIKYSLSIPLTDGPHETPIFLPNGIPFISAEAIKEDKIDFEKIRGYISIEDHIRYSQKYKPKIGDVYMVKSGATTGNLARVETDEEFNIWSPLAAFRPNPDFTTTDFLFFYMKSKCFFSAVELGWNYGTQQNIGMSVLENLRMIRPPLPEQTTIATYLDRKTAEIDELIAGKKRLMELYEEEKTAIINHAVTKGLDPGVQMKDSGIEWLGEIPGHWAVKRLKFLVNQIISGPFGSSLKKETYTDSGYKVYGQEQVIKGDVTYGDYYISKEKFNEMVKYRVSVNDILISCVGTFGKILLIPELFEEGIINPRLIKITPNKHRIFSQYLTQVLKSTLVYEQFNSLSRGGTMGVINLDLLNQIIIPSPPLSEQNGIIDHIETECSRIDTQTERTQKLLDLLTEYRTALISEVVTGKIKVTE